MGVVQGGGRWRGGFWRAVQDRGLFRNWRSGAGGWRAGGGWAELAVRDRQGRNRAKLPLGGAAGAPGRTVQERGPFRNELTFRPAGGWGLEEDAIERQAILISRRQLAGRGAKREFGGGGAHLSCARAGGRSSGRKIKCGGHHSSPARDAMMSTTPMATQIMMPPALLDAGVYGQVRSFSGGLPGGPTPTAGSSQPSCHGFLSGPLTALAATALATGAEEVGGVGVHPAAFLDRLVALGRCVVARSAVA